MWLAPRDRTDATIHTEREAEMSDKGAYEHRTGAGGAGESAETEHRDTARPLQPESNEIDLERRNEEQRYGPRTHQPTRIDPDPRFEDIAE